MLKPNSSQLEQTSSFIHPESDSINGKRDSNSTGSRTKYLWIIILILSIGIVSIFTWIIFIKLNNSPAKNTIHTKDSSVEDHIPINTPTKEVAATVSKSKNQIAFLGVSITSENKPADGGEGLVAINNLYLADSGETTESQWTIKTILSELPDSFGLTSSPDGSHLAFVAVLDDTDGNGVLHPFGDLHQVYVYSLVDDSLQRVTEIDQSHSVYTWSPNGQSIAYAQDNSIESNDTIKDSSIYLVDLDSSSPRILSDNISGLIADLAWSPNNRFIAIVHEPESRIPAHLSLLDVVSGQITEIPVGSNGGLRIAWSPDSQWLAFVPIVKDQTLSLLNTDTFTTKELLKGNFMSEPTWSPDSLHMGISLSFQQEENIDLVTINITNENINRLSDNLVIERTPKWSPDGQRILFIAQEDKNGSLSNDIYVTGSTSDDPKLVLDKKNWIISESSIDWLSSDKEIN